MTTTSPTTHGGHDDQLEDDDQYAWVEQDDHTIFTTV